MCYLTVRGVAVYRQEEAIASSCFARIIVECGPNTSAVVTEEFLWFSKCLSDSDTMALDVPFLPLRLLLNTHSA